ncbi:hypothetical protein CEXT_404421 [Caerostris extrusa]|uniref:Uncharacterized protein n=1 Tax=Caerostris extrusa TaxID=172846 RepID=A0AAV4XLD9_CAEEX|nr:hypothetical protein CEXT_404421 [Caerostris extrusa]
MIIIEDDSPRLAKERLQGRLDSNIERIAEETRWWGDSGNVLQSMVERLEESNASKAANLAKEQGRLERKKRGCLRNLVKASREHKKAEKYRGVQRRVAEGERGTTILYEEERRLTMLKEKAVRNLIELEK